VEVMKAFAVLLFTSYVVADRFDPKLGIWLKDLWVINEKL